MDLNSGVSSADLYELLKSLDSKIDALSNKVDERADEIVNEIGKLDEKLEIYNSSLAELKESVQKKLKMQKAMKIKKKKFIINLITKPQ